MKIIFLRQAYRFIRRADLPLREKIQNEVLRIDKNPKIGKSLTGGNLKGLRSYRFNFAGVNYRIAYQIKDNLIIISIASRENFYRDLA